MLILILENKTSFILGVVGGVTMNRQNKEIIQFIKFFYIKI